MTYPLAGARFEQESSKLNRDLGLVIREAIISAHVERCRKLAGAQFGGLAGAGHIREIERRKSVVPSRKGAKSSVYEFTISGRRKLTAGTSADGQHTVSGGRGASERPSPALSADPGGADAQPTGTPDPKGPGSDTNPAVPSAGAGESPAASSQVAGEPRLFEPEPPSAYDPWRDAA